jgi:hypothetical protein
VAWTCLAGSADSPSVLNLGSYPWPTARSIPIAGESSSPGCTGGASPLPQSGTTSEHSEGMISRPWTLSWAGSHARTSVRQDLERAWTESGPAFIGNSSALLANFDPSSCSWKTLQRSALTPGELSKIWPASGLTVDGALFLRPKLELPTNAIGGGWRGKLWPTLVAGDARSAGSRNLPGSKAKAGLSLSDAVRNNNGERIANVARTSLGTGPLNPDWCEWFMGYPVTWSASAPWAMPLSRTKRGSRSAR